MNFSLNKNKIMSDIPSLDQTIENINQNNYEETFDGATPKDTLINMTTGMKLSGKATP